MAVPDQPEPIKTQSWQAFQQDTAQQLKEMQAVEQMAGVQPDFSPFWVEAYNRRRQAWIQQQLQAQSQAQSQPPASTPEKPQQGLSQTTLSAEVKPALDPQVEAFLARYAVNRAGTDSRKWEGIPPSAQAIWPDRLPMGVADQDFCFVPELAQVLEQRVREQALGYGLIPDSFYEAVLNWQACHHQLQLKRDWIFLSPGAMTGLTWIIEALLQPGEAILCPIPVYHGLRQIGAVSQRRLIEVELKGLWPAQASAVGPATVADWIDQLEAAYQEAQAAHPVKALLLCSPNNPLGRVWQDAELSKLFAWAASHDLYLLVDELHQDWVFEPMRFRPALSIENGRYADRLLTVFSASKTFNLAGVPLAQWVIPNADLRQAVERVKNRWDQSRPNVLSLLCVETAYRVGEAWLNGAKAVVQANLNRLIQGLEKTLPRARWTKPEATYLFFLDLTPYGLGQWDQPSAAARLYDQANLLVSPGEDFGGAPYRGAIRINLACHPDQIEPLLFRLKHCLA